MIVQSDARNGYWYAYNDGEARCTQTPLPSEVYRPDHPPTPSPWGAGTALHAKWLLCYTWGAGVGADFAVPFTSALFYSGPKVAYDVSRFGGIAFGGMATAGTATGLRLQVMMRKTTPVGEGGLCDEAVAGAGRCGDHWGLSFSLPTNGTWKQIMARFGAPALAQEGWGEAVPWDPRDVTGIRIQSVTAGELYDFWIDDVYLLLR
jgi:hypothetical protein